jgi:hypothetical protein
MDQMNQERRSVQLAQKKAAGFNELKALIESQLAWANIVGIEREVFLKQPILIQIETLCYQRMV